YPYHEVPREAVETATRIVKAAGLDVGGIEYLETPDRRRVFYDVNANSNLRPSVAVSFGFDPFDRVVDFLEREVERCRVRGQEAVEPAPFRQCARGTPREIWPFSAIPESVLSLLIPSRSHEQSIVRP